MLRATLTGSAWALLITGALACRARQDERAEKVAFRAQHGDFQHALDEAERLAAEDPNDPELARLVRDAKVALILDQGRQQVFGDELEAALVTFGRAERLDPENATVKNWIAKTRAQLAVEWLDRAAELTGPDQLEEAAQAYDNVLLHAPNNLKAQEGLSRVLLLTNYRSGQSKTYFDDGIRSFRDLYLEQSLREFQVSRHYRENEPARLRSEQAKRDLAAERLLHAEEFEASGLYFAARNEYRLVLLSEPENADGRAGLDRMDREVRAARALAKADMEVRRGALDSAKETLGEAQHLTVAQEDTVSLLQTNIDEKRLSAMYLEAQALTDDYRYPEAVEAFERLLAVAPDYQDAAARRNILLEFIQSAEELYAQALEAPSDEEAEALLRQIHPVIWPEYKDVVQRLEAIETRRAEQEAEQPPEPQEEEGATPPEEDGE